MSTTANLPIILYTTPAFCCGGVGGEASQLRQKYKLHPRILRCSPCGVGGEASQLRQK